MFTDTKQRHRSCSWFVTAASSSMLVAACSGVPLKSGALLQVPSPFIFLLLEGAINQATRVASELSKGFHEASPDRKFGRKLS